MFFLRFVYVFLHPFGFLICHIVFINYIYIYIYIL